MISRMHSTPAFEVLGNHRAVWSLFVAATLVVSSVSVALAGPREQAERIHNRLAGVPPSDAVLVQMTNDIQTGGANGPITAASRAMNDAHFYSVTLKNWAAPWTNREQSVFVPLNDYVTLVIGMVRDGVPFNQILTADMLYYGNKVGTPPTATSNAHYVALEQAMREPTFNPLADLTQTTQSGMYGIPSAATAGAITTRAAAEAFFVAGTNRAMFRFTLHEPLCMDMEQVQDTSIVPGQDSPGRLAQPGRRQPRVLEQLHRLPLRHGSARAGVRVLRLRRDRGPHRCTRRARCSRSTSTTKTTFADGFVTPDDSWNNHWREGQNSLIGWSTGAPGTGNGAKSLGQELASSKAFAQCQVDESVQSSVLARARGSRTTAIKSTP